MIVEGIINEENDSTKVPPQQEDSIVVSRLRREIWTPMQLYVIIKTHLHLYTHKWTESQYTLIIHTIKENKLEW